MRIALSSTRRTEVDAGRADALAHELVGAVRAYYFSYDTADMLRALAVWQELRPLVIRRHDSLPMRLRSAARRAKARLSGTRSAVESTVAGPPMPVALLAELDRLQRVLEWTCDFEAACIIYPRLPQSGFDSARAAIFLLASRWDPSLEASHGWVVHQVHEPEFHPIDHDTRSFEQAAFVESESQVSVQGTRSISAPRRGYRVIADAELFGGGTVTSAGRLIDFDPCQRSVLDFVAGRWDHVVGSSATLERAGVRAPEAPGDSHAQGILLGGRVDTNWYHWMIEHLPRLIQLEQVFDSSVPVVVSDRLSGPALEAVRAVTDREILVAPAGVRTRFDTLILPANAVYHPDTLEIPWAAGTSIDFDAVDEFARRILVTRGGIDTESPRRIFWYRESTHRNLTNQAELIEVAKRWGFTVIHPESCSLADQVMLFQNAEAVISAMGAVTPNYLFMQPGSHILSMTSSASADYIFPGVIGHHVTGSFHTLVGEFDATGKERGRLDFFHQPFRVEPELLEKALRLTLGAPIEST